MAYVVYLEGDDDGLEVVAPPEDVVAHLLDVDVVKSGVDLVHHEERRRSEAGRRVQTGDDKWEGEGEGGLLLKAGIRPNYDKANGGWCDLWVAAGGFGEGYILKTTFPVAIYLFGIGMIGQSSTSRDVLMRHRCVRTVHA